jgi:hypothetical protein
MRHCQQGRWVSLTRLCLNALNCQPNRLARTRCNNCRSTPYQKVLVLPAKLGELQQHWSQRTTNSNTVINSHHARIWSNTASIPQVTVSGFPYCPTITTVEALTWPIWQPNAGAKRLSHLRASLNGVTLLIEWLCKIVRLCFPSPIYLPCVSAHIVPCPFDSVSIPL